MPDKRLIRFVYDTLSKLQECNDNVLLFDYENFPVPRSLEEAVKKIIPRISHVMNYVEIAKKKCNRQSTVLNWDESAAIYLYTMSTSFFSSLNDALRLEDRYALEPWFAFFKLFMTALKKLPSIKGTVWRVIPGDDHLLSCSHDTRILWPVTSCSMDFEALKLRLGEKDTLFAIDVINAKDVCAFSAFPEEQEVILMPGTHVRDKCLPLNTGRLIVAHLEEIDPQDELQYESNKLLEKIKAKYQRNNRIERLINPSKSFPMERSYIKLTIADAKEQHEKEKQLYDVEHSNVIIDTFEKIYDSKTAIDTKTIFDTCKEQEKRLLVLGRAGIGKSTFCRYIAYQWAKGSYWPHYELLVLIPLRCLTTNRYPPLPPGQRYSLIDLLKQEVFQYDLSEKDERLLQKQLDRNKTLWVLDGYDEIKQNVPSHLEYLFEQLLQTPHHIITSRPYMNTLSYDVQMEITGFTDENTVEYVKQFFNQIQYELDDALVKSQRLLNFLRSSSSIWGVAHIPVNLELICSVWSNKDWSDIEHLTITTLYRMMTEWLCRRYLTPPNEQILQLSEDEIDQSCQKELEFLENLAFNAMENNTIIIRPSLLKQALKEAKVSLYDHPNILNIGILKSFNKQGTGTQIETNKDHYFVHLSFQQYFAARYLINALKRSSTEKAIEFITHRKYNQRYALIFTFAADLLSDSDTKQCLNIFWNTIMGESLDLVAIRHMELVISCIEQTSEESILSRRTELSECIANCIKYRLSTGSKTIRHQLLQSLRKAQSVICQQTIINVLINLLRCDDRLTKAGVLFFISELAILNPSNGLITLITTSLNDKNEKVRANACKALGTMGENAATNEVIQKLVSALGDKDKNVRRYACKALEKMGRKATTNEVITKLVSALGDECAFVREKACGVLSKLGQEMATDLVISNLLTAIEDVDEYIRANACTTLGNIGEKAATKQVIHKLLIVLEDQDENVRANACKALGKISGKSVTNKVISKLVNALDDHDQNVRANACEALGKMGEKSVTNKVISKLVSVLGDNDYAYDLRWNAGNALGKIVGKAPINKVIHSLSSALRDESESVTRFFCEVLRSFDEKSVPIEVIQKLMSALEDEDKGVRRRACDILRKMREKKQRQTQRRNNTNTTNTNAKWYC